MIDLNDAYFQVNAEPVYHRVNNAYEEIPNWQLLKNTDTCEPIHIHKCSYELIPNKSILDALLPQLPQNSFLDTQHSFVNNKYMHIALQFPDIKWNDGESDSNLCLFVDNSYDSSSSVIINWGGLRLVCTNGMTSKIFMKDARTTQKHRSELKDSTIRRSLDTVVTRIPELQTRIAQLQNETFDIDENKLLLKAAFNTKIMNYICSPERTDRVMNKYLLFNLITYYISHHINTVLRPRYQAYASRFFNI